MNKKKYSPFLCFFGTYESTFPRTITLQQACRRLKIKFRECHIPYWEKKREKLAFFSLPSLLKALFQLISIYSRLAFRYIQLKNPQALLVGYNGYFDMPLAKFLAWIRKKPLLYTPVFPLYETLVEDREYVRRDSFKSKLIHLLDEVCCRMADLIIIETQSYLNYYSKEFKITQNKFFKIPLGADESTFYPRKSDLEKKSPNQTKVLFYGKFIPLQGISYIIKAAQILENHKDISFEIIGSGQLSEKIHTLAKRLNVENVNFIDWVKYKDLPQHIQEADICLGIFGHTNKAQRGIPIKIYEALAMKKPVITGNSPAAQEVFKNKSNAVLCEMANAQALAESILFLKKEKKLRDNIAEEGYRLYQRLFSSYQITDKFKQALKKVGVKYLPKG